MFNALLNLTKFLVDQDDKHSQKVFDSTQMYLNGMLTYSQQLLDIWAIIVGDFDSIEGGLHAHLKDRNNEQFQSLLVDKYQRMVERRRMSNDLQVKSLIIYSDNLLKFKQLPTVSKFYDGERQQVSKETLDRIGDTLADLISNREKAVILMSEAMHELTDGYNNAMAGRVEQVDMSLYIMYNEMKEKVSELEALVVNYQASRGLV